VATTHELVHYLALSEARFIFVEPEFEKKVRDALTMIETTKMSPTIVVAGSSTTESPKSRV
jgi:hypothetical protein